MPEFNLVGDRVRGAGSPALLLIVRRLAVVDVPPLGDHSFDVVPGGVIGTPRGATMKRAHRLRRAIRHLVGGPTNGVEPDPRYTPTPIDTSGGPR
jgi:hypothetical protein